MSDEEFLEIILKKTAVGDHVLPDEHARLTTLFTPDTQSGTRAKAFVVLSSVCDHHRRDSQGCSPEDDSGTHNILHLFLRTIESKLAEVEERSLLEALSFVGALFAVDWRTGAVIFSRDGFQDSMVDALELFPSSTAVPSIVASILSSACGYKSCRECLSPRCSAWLETRFRHTTDLKLKATVSLALLKLTQSSSANDLGIIGATSDATQKIKRREELFKTFRDILVNLNGHARDAADVVEGMAYLSTIPSIKVRIVDDDELLNKVMSFGTLLNRKTPMSEDYGTTPFGLANLISNLCAYRPHLTEEQAQIERLRRMAQASADKTEEQRSSPEESLDDNEHVRLRARRLTAAGAPELLVAISRATDSIASRTIVGRGFLGLIEDKDNRGKVLQAGGAKALMTIIRASQQQVESQLTSQPLSTNAEFSDVTSIQALAKLAITSSPLQVFGPDVNVSIEAIRPFASMLLHPSSTLLQRFEAMMALTNIASAGGELADRIARTDGVLGKLEFLLLDENHMVRRAAMELICNLTSGSELAFNKFSGEGGDSSEPSKLNASKSRLHILIALADVEDEPTRLAASGALAVLTGSPTACKLVVLLEFEHHRVFPVLKSLIDPSDGEERGPRNAIPNPGLVHRGVVCIRNIFLNLSDEELRGKLASEAVRHSMVQSLTNVVRSAGQIGIPEAVLHPAAEALKWLMDSGVNVIS